MYVKTAFIVIAVMFVFQQSKDIQLFSWSVLKQAITTSIVSTESQLAFGLGLFLLYFIIEKYPKRYIISCAILFILSFKRIAIVACGISYAVYWLMNLFSMNPERRRSLFVFLGILVNLFFIGLVFVVVSGDLDSIVTEYTGLSTNHFLMGRKTYYGDAISEFGNISFTGVGLGQVDTLLFPKYGGQQILHSDILKNYFEFGIILFIAWIGLLFHKTSFSTKALATLIYFNILMFTDNVFIYFDFMFYFYFFILIYLSQVRSPKAL